ncbi:MAG TPA: hypothetical protein VN577_17815 [Terriglobales bacterium]|nr:hypothetical protein [Terriglobales bacterium]
MDESIAILLFFGGAVFYLYYVRSLETRPLSAMARRGVAVSKYIIAVFVSVFGTAGVALLFSTPLFLYSRLAHSPVAEDLFSALLDRPYFPLQIAVAGALGYFTFRWLKEGRPQLVLLLPVAQAVVAAFVYVHRYHPTDWSDVWQTFFNWECGCSASLPQWRVMFPLYASASFAVGALIRKRLQASVTVNESVVAPQS